MTNRRRQDPYRRTPPTIDLTASEFQRQTPPAEGDAGTASDAAPAAPGDAGPVADAGSAAVSTRADDLSRDPSDAPGIGPTDGLSTEPAVTASADPTEAPVTAAEAAPDSATGEAVKAEPGPEELGAPVSAATSSVPPFGAGSPSRFDADRAEGIADPAPAENTAGPADPAPDRPASSPPKGRGMGSLLAASLLGGVVGAGLAVGADTYRTRSVANPLEERVAALEARPVAQAPSATAPVAAPNAAAPPVDLGPLETRLATLEAGARTLGETVTATRQAADEAGRAAARPVEPQPDAEARRQVEALSARLGGVETTARAAATGDALADLSGRLAPLQEAARLTGVNAGAITDVRTRLDTLQNQTAERATQDAAALTALRTRTGELDAKVAAQGAELAKLPPATMQAGLRAIVAGQASDALRAGTPVGPALATLERLGTPAEALAPLRPYAQSAPPTAAALAASFRPFADRMTAEPVRAPASVGDRLLRMVDKIVTVREVGDGSGSDVPGLVARIEAGLARGALADAATAWDALPEPSRQLAAEWGATLKARAAAEAAARQIAAGALSAIDAPSR